MYVPPPWFQPAWVRNSWRENSDAWWRHQLSVEGMQYGDQLPHPSRTNWSCAQSASKFGGCLRIENRKNYYIWGRNSSNIWWVGINTRDTFSALISFLSIFVSEKGIDMVKHRQFWGNVNPIEAISLFLAAAHWRRPEIFYHRPDQEAISAPK